MVAQPQPMLHKRHSQVMAALARLGVHVSCGIKTLSNRQRTSVCIPLLSSSYASNCQDREKGAEGGREEGRGVEMAVKRRDQNRNSRQE